MVYLVFIRGLLRMFYPCNNRFFGEEGKLPNKSGKTGVDKNPLKLHRNSVCKVESNESELRLFHAIATHVLFLPQMMHSCLRNLLWFQIFCWICSSAVKTNYCSRQKKSSCDYTKVKRFWGTSQKVFSLVKTKKGLWIWQSFNVQSKSPSHQSKLVFSQSWPMTHNQNIFRLSVCCLKKCCSLFDKLTKSEHCLFRSSWKFLRCVTYRYPFLRVCSRKHLCKSFHVVTTHVLNMSAVPDRFSIKIRDVRISHLSAVFLINFILIKQLAKSLDFHIVLFQCKVMKVSQTSLGDRVG